MMSGITQKTGKSGGFLTQKRVKIPGFMEDNDFHKWLILLNII
jgi:hypothetical protein